MKTSAFPKILHIGNKQISDLFDGVVEITEKVDGSQLGFGKVNGELFVRSKGKEQDLDNPDKMFEGAVEFVKTIADKLPDNITLYGEWLSKPKHNVLAYDRTPKNGIALFGVYNPETQEHYGMDIISEWAEQLGVDTVPLLFKGEANAQAVLDMVDKTDSFLGGQKIEGVVVKRYTPWMFMGNIPLTVMSGKYVSEKFKEVHARDWKKEHTDKGKLEVAISQYKSEARWNKAIQHLREDGELTGSPSDIGRLIKEVRLDITLEEKENIKEELWKIYKDDFMRHAVSGLPEWYKKKLATGDVDVETVKENGQGV